MSNHENRTVTRQISFRISEEQHDAFVDLLKLVPGADAGSMYREIFTRGLKNLSEFYATHLARALAEREKGA